MEVLRYSRERQRVPRDVVLLAAQQVAGDAEVMRYTYQIRRQLADSEGLIGYSLDANVPGRAFWTLSVWEDEVHLWRFVQRTPHGRVMTYLLPDMGQTEFVHWEVDGSSIPPD